MVGEGDWRGRWERRMGEKNGRGDGRQGCKKKTGRGWETGERA